MRRGFPERDGVKIGYGVFGSGDTTVVFVAIWTPNIAATTNAVAANAPDAVTCHS